MIVARTLPELRDALNRAGDRPLAVVPTMGALHAGHHALVAAAAASGGTVAASLFVNPLQFAPTEDLARYPRDEAGDLAKLRSWGCQLVWLPNVATMYPPDGATAIEPTGPAECWEGAARPGHFRGVALVVAKLFGQTRAETAYFGEKDWQQLQVVRRMVTDLHLPVRVVGVSTVRADDGLALSSRNGMLGAEERVRAPRLFSWLTQTAAAISAGEPVAPRLATARDALAREGFGVDYFELVDGPSLSRLPAPIQGGRLIAAARLGAVRLIDNIPVNNPEEARRS